MNCHFCKYSQTRLNDHLWTTTTCSKRPVWSINGQSKSYFYQAPLSNGHFFQVPRVVVVHRFDCKCILGPINDSYYYNLYNYCCKQSLIVSYSCISQWTAIHVKAGVLKLFCIATFPNIYNISGTLKCYKLQQIKGKRTILVDFGDP